MNNIMEEQIIQNQVKTKKNKITFKKVLKVVGLTILIYILFSILLTFVYRWVNPPITILMLQRCVEQTFSKDREVRLQKDWVDLEDISPYMVTAVVAAEDGNFRHHRGFDFQARKYYNSTDS